MMKPLTYEGGLARARLRRNKAQGKLVAYRIIQAFVKAGRGTRLGRVGGIWNFVLRKARSSDHLLSYNILIPLLGPRPEIGCSR